MCTLSTENFLFFIRLSELSSLSTETVGIGVGAYKTLISAFAESCAVFI